MKGLAEACSLLLILGAMITACTQAEIQHQNVEYTVDGLTMKGYLSYDRNKEEKRPGILIVHEWWGQDDFVRQRADMLAGLGYTALAVDMFGDGKTAGNAEEAAAFTKEITGNMDVLKSRFMAALNLLKEHETVDSEHIAALGYSFGGHVVLEMARQGLDIDGVVSVYGGLTTKNPAEPGEVKTAILVQHGDKDWYVTAQNVTAFKSEMKKAGADLQFIEYKDAGHGFSNPDADAQKEKFKMHLGYNKEADNKSWKDMQTFFKKIFKE